MPQEQERGLGGWQAELAEWPGLWISAHGAASALGEAVEGLAIDAARMRANIDALHGLVFAEALAARLGAVLGKAPAHALVEALSRRVEAECRDLQDLSVAALASEPTLHGALGAEDIAALFDVAAAARHAAAVARPQLEALQAASATASAVVS